jgi:hypothetical protein
MIGQSLLSQMLPASRDIRYGQGQMMGGGGDGRSSNPGWDAMTNAEKAAFYSDNPTMAGITQFGQKALGFAPIPGIGLALMAQKAMFPEFVSDSAAIARGIDPATGLQVGGYGSQPGTSGITPTGLYGDQFAGMPAPQSRGMFESFLNSVLPSSSVSLNPAQVETRAATPNPYAGENPALSSTGSGFVGADVGSGGGFGGGVGTGTSGGTPADAANLGYAQGGMVRLKDLLGKAPGSDDGYGALQDGEFVIKKDAVKRYGVKMLEQINRRKIAKKQVSKFFKNHG